MGEKRRDRQAYSTQTGRDRQTKVRDRDNGGGKEAETKRQGGVSEREAGRWWGGGVEKVRQTCRQAERDRRGEGIRVYDRRLGGDSTQPRDPKIKRHSL